MLYKVLIRSNLEYASVIWNPKSKNLVQKINRVQRKFVKFYCYKFGIEYSSNDWELISRQIGLESLPERRTNHDLIFLHKMLNNEIDCPFLLEKLNIRVPSFFSRNRDFFYVPNIRIEAKRNSPLTRSMRKFNELSSQCPNLDIFSPFSVFRNELRNSQATYSS